MKNGERLRSLPNEKLAYVLCSFDPCGLCPNTSNSMCSTKNCDEVGLTEAWLDAEESETYNLGGLK